MAKKKSKAGRPKQSKFTKLVNKLKKRVKKTWKKIKDLFEKAKDFVTHDVYHGVGRGFNGFLGAIDTRVLGAAIKLNNATENLKEYLHRRRIKRFIRHNQDLVAAIGNRFGTKFMVNNMVETKTRETAAILKEHFKNGARTYSTRRATEQAVMSGLLPAHLLDSKNSKRE